MTPGRLSRRDLLLSLAGAAVAPALGQTPPSGSARYLVELIAFRQPGPAPKAIPAGPLSQATAIAGRIEVLPETAWQLGAIEASLHRRDYTVLAHTEWAAIVPANGRTTARLEDVLAGPTPLAGSVAVQRSQYLFLGVDVDFAVPDGPTYSMRERRRVKFGERHYFDHPAFGLIAQITPSRGAAATD
jgi:hypothetical protein